MGNQIELEKIPQTKSPEESSELQIKREILSMTIPSVEVLALIAPPKEGNSRFPLPLEKSQWAPILCEAARVNADSQYSLGVSRRFYPKGLIIDGSYKYTFEQEKTLAEAQVSNSKIEERKYKPRVFIPNETMISSLFPESRYIRELLEDVRHMASGPLAGGIAEKTAGIIFQKLANCESVGPLTINSVFGIPVLKVHNPEDLHALQSHQAVELPSETQSFSYVVSRYTNRVVNKGTLSGFPLVVCLETCPADTIQRHVYAQMLFASVAKPEEVSPILISRDPEVERSDADPVERFEEQLDEKLKNWWILKGVIEARQPVEWLTDPDNVNTQRFQKAHERELFFQRKGEHSELYIGNWLGMSYNDDEKKLSQDVKAGVLRLTATKLGKATQIMGDMISLLPSLEYQLAVVNYLSFFHLNNWDEAQAMLAEFEIETGGKFRKLYNIPPLKNQEARRQIQEDIQDSSIAPLASKRLATT